MDFSLYHAAIAADAAWSAELKRQFGKNAGDVRYTARGKGEPGSELRRLHATFRSTSDAWLKAMRAAREERSDASRQT